MVDRAIISVAVTVLLVVLAVALLLLVLPLFQRLEFDLLCQDQVRRMDAAGGLNAVQTAEFAAILTGRGYTVERLEATVSAPFGQDLTLNVRATRRQHQVAADFTLKEVVVSLHFTRTVICRKIITAAGEP